MAALSSRSQTRSTEQAGEMCAGGSKEAYHTDGATTRQLERIRTTACATGSRAAQRARTWAMLLAVHVHSDMLLAGLELVASCEARSKLCLHCF
jgi:hypothetical protein